MDSKKWYESKTIWGSIVALRASAVGLFGLHIDPAAGDALALALANGAAAVGAIVAILGRIGATRQIN
ncbi:hypothetical protein [Consotaella salsifontis]|uniref:Holin n=1 Tax=Consotaella salsifontis TaxID=1365950 RepID=A0A1T4MDH2_9HYPH|nr:hypothetical protein [Consotaella salsifontis]SJZ64794.1 hypothetical protein SAMN05428963_10274 [Consotaella salsifontis]